MKDLIQKEGERIHNNFINMDSSGYLKDLSSQLTSLKDLAAKRVQELETLVPEVKALKKKYSNKFRTYVNYISQYKTKIKNDFQ